MMVLIEKFNIKNLHNYYDVELKFDYDRTIYIGENGIGKTTILSILYYLLELNYSKLIDYEFDSLGLQFSEEESLNISKEYILRQLRNKDLARRNRYPKRLIDNLLTNIQENEELVQEILELDNNDLEFENNLHELLKNKQESMSYPIGLLKIVIDELFNQSKPTEEQKLINKIKEIKEYYKVLYFPTYRRIEGDLLQLDRKLEHEGVVKESSGELIHFGMSDVEDKIKDLLSKISKKTNESYDNMTGNLLNTFAEISSIESDNEALDKKTVDIALSRLGNKVSQEAKNIILDKIATDELSEDRYLNYLVSSIVRNYKELEDIDSRIIDFKNRINKYLYNKKFFYNQQNLKLEIKRVDDHGEPIIRKGFFGEENEDVIELSRLSSGEKQIVSAFSKIFLEDEKKLIVLFDEPELSLSVPWQEEFIYDISQADRCEFLITVTHSPFIFTNMLKYAKEIKDEISEATLNASEDYFLFNFNDSNLALDDDLPF